MAAHEGSKQGAAGAIARLSRRTFVQRIAGLGAATILATCNGAVVIPSPTPTRKLRRIGYLSGNATAAALYYAKPFRDQLRELGYIEGRDIFIDFRIAESVASRLPAMAAELVALPVDVLIAEAAPAHSAAIAATKTIPIVLTLSADPVAAGYVPGRNITGLITQSPTLTGKRVEYLKEAVPRLAHIGIIWNANIPSMLTSTVQPTQVGARTLGVETEVFDVHNPSELDAAVETMARQHLDGLVMLTGSSIIRLVAVGGRPPGIDYGQVPELAAKYQIPQIFSDIEIVRAGGLMHFSPNYAAIYQRAALMVDNIFKGAKPADMPIEPPANPDLILNLTMAGRLGLIFPDSLKRQATEIIS